MAFNIADKTSGFVYYIKRDFAAFAKGYWEDPVLHLRGSTTREGENDFPLIRLDPDATMRYD